MLFAALLLLSPIPLIGDLTLPVANPASILAVNTTNSSAALPAETLIIPEISSTVVPAAPSAPSMPQPKLLTREIAAESSSAEPAAFQPGALALEPVKSASHRGFENRNQKKIWYGLMVAGHSGAAFDAWTTRRALSGNWGTEADPLMRPFAHSGAIYAAIQVAPLLADFVGRRAMNSERPWVRRLWWVPQTVGASMSFQAAIHNVGVVP
jgi:hypothetical protein